MNKKKFFILFTVVGTILVFLGILLAVITIVNKQNQEKKDTENKINVYYTGFKQYADQFADIRQSYTEAVTENLYPESVSEEYDNWLEAIDSYKKLVDQAIIPAENLRNLCIDKTYSNKDVENNCTAYIINYETIMNYFVKDLEEFNTFITDYLEDNDSSDVTTYDLDTDKYNYLDVNEDGKFIGKD